MGKFFLLCLFFLSFDSLAEINISDDSTQREAEEDAINSAGYMSSSALDAMTEDGFDEMFGIDSSESMADFGGGDTNLSLVRTFQFFLSCMDTGDEPSGLVRGGIYFEGVECSIVNGVVADVSMSWCQQRDGFRCLGGMQDIEISFDGSKELGDSELSLVSCDGIEGCSFLFVARESDSFDGSDLDAEGAARDDAEGSYVFDLIEANQNSEYYDEANKEVSGLQEYVDNNFDEMNETGMMGIYRNSPEDIAIFGERSGQIGVDNVAADTGVVCVGMDLNNLSQCVADYPLVEYVCDTPDDLVCSYERTKTTEYCTRKKVMTCSSKLACSNVTELYDNGPISNLVSSNWEVTKGYNSLSVRSGGDNHYGTGFYESSLTFDISDMEKISSFILTNINVDDYFSIHVNDVLVFSGYKNNNTTSSGKYPVGFNPGSGGQAGIGSRGIEFSDGSKTTNDRGQAVFNNININIKDYLKDGSNTFTMRLGVISGGEVNPVEFSLSAFCGCNWTETWEEVCNATNY